MSYVVVLLSVAGVVVSVYGPYPDAEAALTAAQELRKTGDGDWAAVPLTPADGNGAESDA